MLVVSTSLVISVDIVGVNVGVGVKVGAGVVVGDMLGVSVIVTVGVNIGVTAAVGSTASFSGVEEGIEMGVLVCVSAVRAASDPRAIPGREKSKKTGKATTAPISTLIGKWFFIRLLYFITDFPKDIYGVINLLNDSFIGLKVPPIFYYFSRRYVHCVRRQADLPLISVE